MEDDEASDDAPKGIRNKGKPDENREEKDRVKRSLDAISLRGGGIGDVVKLIETLLAKHLDTKVEFAEKKDKHKDENWARIADDDGGDAPVGGGDALANGDDVVDASTIPNDDEDGARYAMTSGGGRDLGNNDIT
ncbi:hypothetical protein D1007_06674 [Hordeum vulgare]|nr:hypothetical protein D1007_06674 [Hordeum vulgare]